jgi:flagellar biosynthesis component FlhA
MRVTANILSDLCKSSPIIPFIFITSDCRITYISDPTQQKKLQISAAVVKYGSAIIRECNEYQLTEPMEEDQPTYNEQFQNFMDHITSYTHCEECLHKWDKMKTMEIPQLESRNDYVVFMKQFREDFKLHVPPIFPTDNMIIHDESYYTRIQQIQDKTYEIECSFLFAMEYWNEELDKFQIFISHKNDDPIVPEIDWIYKYMEGVM